MLIAGLPSLSRDARLWRAEEPEEETKNNSLGTPAKRWFMRPATPDLSESHFMAQLNDGQFPISSRITNQPTAQACGKKSFEAFAETLFGMASRL